MYVPGLLEKDQTKVNQAVRALASGRSNAAGQVTLAVSPAVTTVVVAPNCSAQSFPFLTPLSATAQAAGAWISAIGKGQFTISHSASAATDRTFGWLCAGG
jgi:hypothetical protein